MPAADWTSISNGAGAFAIVADATSPSPPDIMRITAGGQFFENITAGPFKDSRVSGWCRQSAANTQGFFLALRSLDDTTFTSAPATFFLAQIYAQSATNVSVEIDAIVNGVSTTIVNTSVSSQNGNPINTWQQFQFSSFNSGTDILLRIAQWNLAVFVPLVDAAAPIASFPTLDAAGSCRFGGLLGGGTLGIDDVNYYSLT